MSYRFADKQVLYTGKKVRLEAHHLEDEDGHRVMREVIVHPGAVVVIPWLDEKTILLIRNRRYVINQVLLELPAGTLEKNEDPINCAGRELQEETGFLAGRLKPVTAFYSSPGIMTERMYVYAAYDLERTERSLDEGEDIELVALSFKDAIELVGSGEIQDAKTIAALLLFERFHLDPLPRL